MSEPLSRSVVVALGEYDTGWHEPSASVARACSVIASAAAAGADLVVLPEMCATGFTMESERWAEPVHGTSATALAAAARTNGVHVLAGLATTRSSSRFNSALLFDPAGAIVAAYDKQRRFAYANEDLAYSTGVGGAIATVRGVRFGLFICYDLRSPEIFRAVGPSVDAFALVANWPSSRQEHWSTLLRARAIENQACMIAVNRRGIGGGLHYDGGSQAFDAWGRDLSRRHTEDGIALVAVHSAEVTRIRSEYRFSEDARSTPPTVGAFAPTWMSVEAHRD